MATAPMLLDINQKVKVHYAIPTWLRDEQIRINISRVKDRIEPHDKRPDPVAIVCFGPSLNDTWEQVRNYKYVISCSGSHKFLIERGIVPTWHVEVDPREHKTKLIGTPHADVEYLIASACHPKVLDHLEGFKVKLWHVFDTAEEGLRLLPPGEWALTGGSSVGLRALTIARFFGFTDLHVFGMDGNEGASGKHAAEHPNQPKGHSLVECDGKTYRTTPGLLECARQTFHELDQMPDVKATFYGDGLVQSLAKTYVPKHIKSEPAIIGFNKPELISAEYRDMNRAAHLKDPTYGVHAGKYAEMIIKLSKALNTTSILDYGCGKGFLGKAMPFPIWEYDPAIPGKSDSPRPADIVVCVDVLEHIEPDKLEFVLDDLRRCMKKVGFFSIHLGAASKKYSNGKNMHLIQNGAGWWQKKLSRFFEIGSIKKILVAPKDRSWDHLEHHELHVVVGPRAKVEPEQAKPLRRWQVLEQLAKENGWKRGAEIGVKEGFTFLHLLQTCPDLHMTGVDLFEPRPGLEQEGGESHVKSRLPEHEARLRSTIAELYPERAVLIKGDSVASADQIADGSLDFVFIDADHREHAVRADIFAWRPKIRPGGILAGHDAQDAFPGVTAAINDLCPGWKLLSDSVWISQC